MQDFNRAQRNLGSVENKSRLFAPVKWEKSIVLLSARMLANLFAFLSLFTWIMYLLAHKKKAYRPWMADTWVIILLSLLILGLVKSSAGDVSLFLAIFAVYVLIDAIGSVVRDIVISPIHYRDQHGPYVSVYDGARWLILGLLNVIEVVLCFAVLFLYYGKQFYPSITEPITAIYFSFITFVSLGYGDIKPICATAKILVCFEIFPFIFFLAVRVPAAVSILRVKEEPNGPKRIKKSKKTRGGNIID